ncbi:trypsin-like peptidase domain-containing protein [candidate division KSB1 bacterium]|nr:trypsin-like peptidase domain-containing protein [candidate division KSB1 bacterium]
MKKVIPYFLIFIIGTFLSSAGFSQPFPVLEKLQSEISGLITTVKYSIVTISSQSTRSYVVDKNEGLKSLFWDEQEEKKNDVWVVGSGIIYNENGYIITKSSMLAGFEKIKVTLFDKTDYYAIYIGTDELSGLAILKIDASDLTPVHIGNSDDVPLYSLAMVLGNSMGISPYASFGIINGKTEQGQFIISAPLNPGSTGAGVFNLCGEWVGIVSAQLDTDVWMMGPTYVNNAQQNGIVFSSNLVRDIADEIIKMQHEQKGWLGIDILADSLEKGKIVISNVIKDSPANRSGLKKRDRLLKYNDSILKSTVQLASLIEQTKPGKTVSIDFVRNSRSLKVFPQIARKRPGNFTPKKPGKISSQKQNPQSPSLVQQPVILSPERFNQINMRMKQMEKEINRLKSQVKEYQQ